MIELAGVLIDRNYVFARYGKSTMKPLPFQFELIFLLDFKFGDSFLLTSSLAENDEPAHRMPDHFSMMSSYW